MKKVTSYVLILSVIVSLFIPSSVALTNDKQSAGFDGDINFYSDIDYALSQISLGNASACADTDVYYGDIDGEGTITAADALIVLQYSVQKISLTDDQKIRADVVAPLYVNTADALAILQFSVGKISEFDPPERPTESSEADPSQPESSEAEPSQPESSIVESSDAEYSYVAPNVSYNNTTLEKYGNDNTFDNTHTEAVYVDGIKSVVQTNEFYSADLNFDVDAQMVNIYVTDGAGGKLNSWAKKYNNKVSVFTPANRSFTDYYQLYPDRYGKDEQRKIDGSIWEHGSYGYYMIPTTYYTEYKKTVIDACFNDRYDYEVEMMVFEEPEVFTYAVYADGFKEEWVNYFGTEWEDPESSPSARYKTSELIIYMFKRELTELAAYVKSKSPTTKVIIATHSSINYDAHKIVGGANVYADLPNVDGIVGQTWSDCGNFKMKYNGSSILDEFMSELIEYGTYANGFKDKWVFALSDASTDRADLENVPEETRKAWYMHQLASQLMHANINRFEPCIWPSRAFGMASDEYKTIQLNMIRAFDEVSGQATDLYSGTAGVYIGTSDSLSWQRSVNNEYGRHCHYALSLSLAKKGIFPNTLNIDLIKSVEDLKDVRLLVLSYDYQKPVSEEINKIIAEWVKQGGNLLYVGGNDPISTEPNQWWTNGGETPYENLMRHIEVGVKVSDADITDGTFSWIGEGKYNSFGKATIDAKFGAYASSYTPTTGTFAITKNLLSKNGHLIGFEAPTTNGGRVISFGIPTAWLANASNGSSQVIDMVKYSCNAAGLNYLESDIYMVKRGNIVTIHGISGTTTLTGKFIDLSQDNIPVINSITVKAGESYVLKDISGMINQSGVPTLVQYTGSKVSLDETSTATTLKVWGTKGAIHTYRYVSNGKTFDSISITKNSTAIAESEYTVQWDATENTLLVTVRHDSGSNYDIVVNWK